MSLPQEQKKGLIPIEESLLSRQEVEMCKSLSYLLNEMGLSDGVIVDRFAFKIRYGIDGIFEQPSWINIVADSSKLPWTPNSSTSREISLLSHPNYNKHEDFQQRYGYSLRLIGESSTNMQGLSDKFTFSTGEIINIAKPANNIRGFTGLIQKYCQEPPDYHTRADVKRWKSNIERLRSIAQQKIDTELIEACLTCEDQLSQLYEHVEN